jgi:hypothetical protein
MHPAIHPSRTPGFQGILVQPTADWMREALRLYGAAVVRKVDVSSSAEFTNGASRVSLLKNRRSVDSRSPMLRLATRERWAGLLAVLGLWLAPRTSGSEDIAGEYKVAGTAHVAISPFPTHDYPGEMAATLSRSSAPDAFSLRLKARGYACTLQIRVTSDGSLHFPDGATCPFDVSQPDARGHVNAQLRAARARIVGTRLEMDLRFEVNGSIQLRIPSRTIRVLGAEFQTPATWAPTAPVRGTAAANGSGARQHPDPTPP